MMHWIDLHTSCQSSMLPSRRRLLYLFTPCILYSIRVKALAIKLSLRAGLGRTQFAIRRPSRLQSVSSSDESKGSRPNRYKRSRFPKPSDGRNEFSQKVRVEIDELRTRHEASPLNQAEYDGCLAQCVAHDEWELVLDILDMMKSVGLRQESSTYKACLECCFHASNADSSREILNSMQPAGVDPSLADYSMAALTFCRSYKKDSSWLGRALAIVRNHPKVPVAAYDAVLTCLVEEKDWRNAIRLLRKLEKVGKPVLSSYRLVVECCVAGNQPEQALQVLNACIARGIEPTLYSFELTIVALCKRGQWRRARQLLDMMTDKLSMTPTLKIYNSLLQCCSRAKEIIASKQLLSEMRRHVIPDIRSYNAVISACANSGRWREAMQVLDQCHRSPKAQPDIYTYTNVMRACAKAGKTRKALTLLQVIKDKKLKLDAYAYTAALEACAKAGMSRKALDLLDEMQAESIMPTAVTFSVAITACGNSGEWEQALSLLSQMQEKNLEINVITYNSALTAVSKAAKHLRSRPKTSAGGSDQDGLYKHVLTILDRMREDGIEPDGFSFSAAISCCGAEGRWKEALELVDIMDRGGPKTRPNKIAYTAAITSCGRSGRVEDALKLFRRMKDEGLAADRVAYNALFSAMRIAKRPSDAYNLWEEMLGNGASRTTKLAAARDASVSPDIISVTDAIAALSSIDTEQNRDRVDAVFEEAVRRRIVLTENFLDSQWEVDLSGLTLPVGRAALRYILKRLQLRAREETKFGCSSLVFITGVGVNGRSGKVQAGPSLRDYVQMVLRTEFGTAIDSHVPDRALGTVEISQSALDNWLRGQNEGMDS